MRYSYSYRDGKPRIFDCEVCCEVSVVEITQRANALEAEVRAALCAGGDMPQVDGDEEVTACCHHLDELSRALGAVKALSEEVMLVKTALLSVRDIAQATISGNEAVADDK